MCGILPKESANISFLCKKVMHKLVALFLHYQFIDKGDGSAQLTKLIALRLDIVYLLC